MKKIYGPKDRKIYTDAESMIMGNLEVRDGNTATFDFALTER